MTLQSGQALRRLGLIIEAVAMLGLLTVARNKGDLFKGGQLDPGFWMAVCLAVGFGIWLSGTLAIYQARRRGS
jgi:hypothetical protein